MRSNRFIKALLKKVSFSIYSLIISYCFLFIENGINVTGKLLGGKTMIFHKDAIDFEVSLTDCYLPYIGPKAYGYFMFITRFSEWNNKGIRVSNTKRSEILKKIRMSTKTVIHIEKILEATNLIKLKRESQGRGNRTIVYEIYNPLQEEQFKKVESEIKEALVDFAETYPKGATLLGNEIRKRMGR
jgi:hypothetical protein